MNQQTPSAISERGFLLYHFTTLLFKLLDIPANQIDRFSVGEVPFLFCKIMSRESKKAGQIVRLLRFYS